MKTNEISALITAMPKKSFLLYQTAEVVCLNKLKALGRGVCCLSFCLLSLKLRCLATSLVRGLFFLTGLDFIRLVGKIQNYSLVPISRSNRTRSATGGCVLKSPEIEPLLKGLAKNKCAVEELGFWSWLPYLPILSRALANPSG